MLLPVRHHSPACARMVRDKIRHVRPAVVLIEGPSDFNDRIDELFLDHVLPISIYSYVAWNDGRRRGVYYPLCEYSPEWQGLQAARECGAAVRFIDLPYGIMPRDDRLTHCYADDQLRSSDYMKALCESFQVENFDDAWDLIAEQDPDLTIDEILHRVTEYCRCLREMDGSEVRSSDSERESFMAAQIRSAQLEFGEDRVIAITGGYHTSGLEVLLGDPTFVASTAMPWPEEITERGIALTPYSYDQLDNLKGYDAGMPSPGFYHEAWKNSADGFHLTLLGRIAKDLRRMKQTASTADLIGVEASAVALASIRGHRRVWRRDLIDAVISALVKDDFHATHPFLLATQRVLRGGKRGQLAEGSPLPPLVSEIRQQLESRELRPDSSQKTASLDLSSEDHLKASRILHRLRVLGISGFEKTGGVDFAQRSDLSLITETWSVQWRPAQDADMIEASRYGSALEEAAAACLREKAEALERNASDAALLLLDSVLAGVMAMATELREQLAVVIREDGSLSSVVVAMEHLLFLYSWDDTLGAHDSIETGTLLMEAYERALWLLSAGGTAATDKEQVDSVRVTRDVFERAEASMSLDRDAFAEVLMNVQQDPHNRPALRGACGGALWSLNRADPDSILRDLRLFGNPEELGDFLTGLFALAREEAQRESALLEAVRVVVAEWSDEDFLTALPSLRLAFMYFTSREKHHLASCMFADREQGDLRAEAAPVPLVISTEEATRAMEFESRLYQLAKNYGVKIEMEEQQRS